MPSRDSLAWGLFLRHPTNVFISAVIVLMLLGYARIYTVTQDLKTAQYNACQLRVAGRADTNTHDRIPLRAALNYIASLGVQGEKRATTRAQFKASRDFAVTFHGYAKSVSPLPNPKC